MKKNRKKERSAKPGARRRDWMPLLILALIILATLLLYGRTLYYDYTFLDDNELILKNQHILRHFSNIVYAFKEDVFFGYHDAYYRPLLTTSFILDGQFGVASLFPFHATNLIIHILCAWLIFIVLRRLTIARGMAVFFALLFTLHPVLSQAVAWVPGRNDSLLTLFVLLSFLMLLHYLGRPRWSFYALHVFFFALALFTKETVLLFVVVCIVYLYLIVRPEKPKAFLLPLGLGWSLVALLYLVMRSAAMVHPVSYSFMQMIYSTWISLPVLLQFLGKIFFPFNLSVLPTMLDTTCLYGVAAMALLILGAWWRRATADWMMIAFGAVWFLLFIIPSFIRPNADILGNFLEHRTYLPIIGIFLIISGLLKGLDLSTKRIIMTGVIILLTMSILTIRHVPHFKNRLVFWNNAALHSPHSPLAQRNLGAMLYLEGDHERAAHYFRRALALNPEEPMANMNLGLIAMDNNQLAAAESLFVREATINPFYANVYFNLGILNYKKGCIDNAANAWEKTIQLDGNFASAYYNLIVLFYENNRLESARACLRMLQDRNMPIPPELAQMVGF